MRLTEAIRLSVHSPRPAIVAFTGAGGKSTAIFRLAQEIVADGFRVVTTTTTRIAAEQIGLAPIHLLTSGNEIDWADLEQNLDRYGHCLLLADDQPPKAVGLSPHLVDLLAARAEDLNLAAVLVEADGSALRPAKAPAAHEPVIPDSTTLLIPVLGLDAIGLPVAAPHIHRPEYLRQVLAIEDPATRLTPEMAVRLLCHPQGGAKGRPASARFLPLLNKADSPTRRLLGRLIASGLMGKELASLLATTGHSHTDAVWERWGPTAAVVLAAGGASRMGRPKQLLEIAGQTLVERAARLALGSGATEVLVVTGAYGEQVAAALVKVAAEAKGKLRLVHNPAWQSGQASSVHSAVRALSAHCQAALFFPVDQPNLPVALLRQLWQRWRKGADRVATEVAGEVRGAPAIFDQRYWPALLSLEGDQGARPLLRGGEKPVATVSAHASILTDVDTPAEWATFNGNR
ncbi:MAG: putative selenium-dependent hydroxylase accessory protein YqeC [Caldilineaceae bacterium]|nr:putative selenium-dependent hydroxylase accessory protein YqeC [Caldilineaceae bacterium]